MDVTDHPAIASVSLDRGDGRNSIDDAMIGELDAALAKAESDVECRLFVITSGAGVFSTGMDLAAAGSSDGADDPEPGGSYFDLLQRLRTTPRIVVVAVDGKVAGGGVGLVAAADLVCATPQSTFALPEALWGLLPCVVLPFLARRIGVHRATTLMLTTQPVDTATATTWGLVDLAADDPATVLRPLAYRAGKLDPATIAAGKRYSADLAPLHDDARARAISELGALMRTTAVRDRLAAFAAEGRFPWEG